MNRNSRPHVVAICGSLRDESKTRLALHEVRTAAEEAGARTTLVDLRRYDLPSVKADGDVPDADRLREMVAAADSVVLGTPNYHGSYSGALKDALDHCGRDEFADTTVGLLEVAGGQFPGSALAHLRTVSRTLNAWTLPTEVAIPNSSSTVTEAGITDSRIADRAQQLGTELVEFANVAQHPELQAKAEAGSARLGD